MRRKSASLILLPESEVFCRMQSRPMALSMINSKNEKDDLTSAEKKALSVAVRILKGE